MILDNVVDSFILFGLEPSHFILVSVVDANSFSLDSVVNPYIVARQR
jgi:hypothetical protein